jgi:hypothetical protein
MFLKKRVVGLDFCDPVSSQVKKCLYMEVKLSVSQKARPFFRDLTDYNSS